MLKGWARRWGALGVLVATSAHAQDDRGRDRPAAPVDRFAVDAGVDGMMLFGTGDELGPPATVTSTSPIFGLAAGSAFPIGSAFRLGPELRGVFVPRSTSAYDLTGRGTTFGDQWGVVFGVTGTVPFGG